MKNNLLPLFLIYFILINSSLFFTSSSAFSQRSCQAYETEHFQKNKDKIAGSKAFEDKLNYYITQKEKELKNNSPLSLQKIQRTQSVYKIPVIVHVIHNGEPIGEGTNLSAAQIYGQIEVLNEDYNLKNPNRNQTIDIFKDLAANISVEFVAATIDPQGRPLPEAGIHREKGCLTLWNRATFDIQAKPATYWNPNEYLNIWTANFNKGEYGYAQFPIVSTLTGIENEDGAANTDGVVINYRNFGSIEKTPNNTILLAAAPLNLGRTATHEIGHYLGLLHTWGLSKSCAVDDFCEDTPNTSKSQTGCKLNEAACEAGKIIMSQNFMDYADDGCMTLFTEDQAIRMRIVFGTSPRRKELLQSKAADPMLNRVFILFEPSTTKIIKNGKIKFLNQSIATGNKQITSYEWTFAGANPATSTQASPSIVYPQIGNFIATLKITASDGSSQTKSISIEVIDDNLTALDQTVLDFEDKNYEKDNWTFQRSSTANWRLFSEGAYQASNFSVYAPNKDSPSCEAELSFTSPFIRTPTNRIFEISFDVAYAFDTNKLADSLKISYATDAGNKFTTLWKQGGEELKTAIARTVAFSPLPSEWKSYKLYVEVENGVRFIQVKFENEGANNNNLYLDNLKIAQANDLQAPIVDFDVNYPLILLTEKARFYSKTQFGVDFNWTIEGATSFQATGISPQISFDKDGIYDVTLQSSNPLGTKQLKKTKAIEVIKGQKVSNVIFQNLTKEILNGKPLAGHDEGSTISKAEFFTDLAQGSKLRAVDIFFADAALIDLNKTFDVVMWSANSEGKPDTELYRQKVPYSLVHRDIFERRQFTRVVFEEAQIIPAQFFISVELEYTSGNSFVIFTEKKQEAKGWERKSNGDWLSYAANRGQNYSNAISVILFEEGILGVEEENGKDLVHLYPNPTTGKFQLETQNLRVELIEIYSSIGELIYQKRVPNSFITTFAIEVPTPKNGLYLVRLHTPKGIITQKIIIEK